MNTQETTKIDYKVVKAEAATLGLATTGKAQEIADRIAAFKASQAKVETRGRKINPESARQIRLSNTNVGHRGRPADPNSAWNKRQAELKAKREAGVLKLGRQVNPESARQKRLALKGTLPLGRPKVVKEEVAVAEVPAETVAE
jgi:hypothetical protein